MQNHVFSCIELTNIGAEPCVFLYRIENERKKETETDKERKRERQREGERYILRERKKLPLQVCGKGAERGVWGPFHW